ncbi:alpha/beta hydrolase [Hymenobacter sp. UYP22]|uniref:alpha/beta fold hydrolase n=1 Tax=Hymenobacter sp. UYP22 TaxID=3156348 RepID=UPI0033949926
MLKPLILCAFLAVNSLGSPLPYVPVQLPPLEGCSLPLTKAEAHSLPAAVDTLVRVGGHQLHFTVWPGQQPILLLEAGGGDTGAVWQQTVKALYRATGATIVTYDRAGFGRSSLNPKRMSLVQQVKDLKAGLDKLRLGGDYQLVGHSFGGYFSTLFAARYPRQVRAAVLLDASHVAFYTDARVAAFQREYGGQKEQFRHTEPGKYWMLANAEQDVQEMRRHPFPTTVPVVDILADRSYGNSAAERAEWAQAHQAFVAGAANRTLVLAPGSGHYVMQDSPQLVVETVARVYQECKAQRHL